MATGLSAGSPVELAPSASRAGSTATSPAPASPAVVPRGHVISPRRPQSASVDGHVGRAVERTLARSAVGDEDSELDWMVWTPDDVGDWVDTLVGDQLGDAFRQNKVDGPTLLELTENDLQNLLGVSSPLQRSKIIGHIRVFQIRRARLLQQAGRFRSPRGESPNQSVSTGYVVGGREVYNGNVSYHCGSLASSDSRRDHDREGWSGNSRLSRFTNPCKVSTAGLTSYFGLDSPSYSLRGSFSTAPRRPEQNASGPGPCSYNVQNNRPTSPRATIGNSPRNTSMHFVDPSKLYGDRASTHSMSSPGAGRRIKGGVIGSTPRFKESSSARFAPGPTYYQPRQTYLSTFK